MTTRGGRARRAVAACSAGLIAMLAACSAGHDTAPTRPASPASPADQRTTAAAPARSTGTVAPLTGMAVTAAVAQRPAVAVPVSGPDPNGLGSTDLVFEEMSSPVRYLAVFQSAEANIGPVAATLPIDGQALSVLHPLTGYDGGTAAFISVLDATKIVDVGYPGHASLYASGSDGLTVSTAAVAAAGRSDGAPPPLFSYRAPGEPLASARVTHPASVRVDVPGQPELRWDYDVKAGRWRQSAGGPRVSAANLVVQIVAFKTVYLSRKYGQTTQSARVIGTGPATVFSIASPGTASGGSAAAGTWAKPGLAAVTNYFDASHLPMDFAPGPTWIVLAPAGTRIIQAGG
jgi:Protein of unknown function (DUF3048) C-terminal domain